MFGRILSDRFVLLLNCHKNGNFTRECRFPRNQENKGRENNTRTITVETPTQNALIAQDGIGGYDWSYQAKEEQPTNYALMALQLRNALIIEDWNSDDESEIDYIVRPSTEKIKSIKTVRETDAPKQNKHHPRGNQRNWNNLMSQILGSDFKMINKSCYVCGSFEHLHYVCDNKVEGHVGTNSRRTVGVSINTVIRPINTAASTPIVNLPPRPKSNAFKRVYSQSLRPFNRYYANMNSFINTNVNTSRVKNTTARDRAVGNPQQKEYKEKAVINSGCSRHMTGNKCYLDEYEDYDGGFVSCDW
ncbi:hypothetical protein Tco_0256964 [Tanacetum coccineum]